MASGTKLNCSRNCRGRGMVDRTETQAAIAISAITIVAAPSAQQERRSAGARPAEFMSNSLAVVVEA